MLIATVTILARDWVFPAGALVAIFSAAFLWSFFRSPIPKGARVACLLLKLLGVVALAACLLEPVWVSQRPKPGSNVVAFLADNSQSLQLHDPDNPKTRGEELRALALAENAPWQQKLSDVFQVRRYFFDGRLQGTRDFSELNFDGKSSALAGALKGLGERYRGQPLAGIILLTDGNATDAGDKEIDVAGLPPIYPVMIGNEKPVRDISALNVQVSQTAFEDAPVTVQAEVAAFGYGGDNIVAELVPVEAARPSTNQTKAALPTSLTLRAAKDNEKLLFRFQVRPEKPGLSFFNLRVFAEGEQKQFHEGGPSREATLVNNQKVFPVDRGQGPFRILYVSGRPNWEYKFLNRALAEDTQVELVALIRVAKREPKFAFRGRAGESSNPLFRGFQGSEEAERYDQPVLVRLNTKDEFELRGGFPKTAEELYSYHAVILDDLEAEFFAPDQMVLLQKFVADRGGGVLMLGGADSLHEGKYHKTPVGDMLPVYLDRITPANGSTKFKLNLTRDGWLQPWVRLRNVESDEKARLDEMPPFAIVNAVRDVKPGAMVLASLNGDDGRVYPGLVAQRFGKGRTACLATGDFWRWGLQNEAMQRDMAKSWRQIARWLVSDVPNRIAAEAVSRPEDGQDAVRLQVRVADKKFLPVDNCAVTFSVTRAGTNSGSSAQAIQIPAEASPDEPGLYTATYLPRETGGYRAVALAKDAAGKDLGSAEAGFASDPAAEEFKSLQPNRALLESLARQSGGELVSIGQIDKVNQMLSTRKVPVMESWSEPLWHQPVVFLFALCCLVAEWGIRRRHGLA